MVNTLDCPQTPEQLVAKAQAEWGHPKFQGNAFSVPFALDGLTEMALKSIAKEHQLHLSLIVGSDYAGVSVERKEPI